MIKIAPEGDVTIRITTSGSENGDLWTVYPYLDKDPTLQRVDEDKAKLIKAISETIPESEGVSVQKEAEAVATLLRNVGDLDLKVHQIDIDPESDLAKELEKSWEIRDMGSEVSGGGEAQK